MALEKKTLFEKVEIDKDGNITMLLKKAVVDGTELVSYTLHRILVPVGKSIDTHLDANSQNILAEGYPVIPAAVRARAVQLKTMMDGLPPVEKATPRAGQVV